MVNQKWRAIDRKFPEQYVGEIDAFRAALILGKANRIARQTSDKLRDHIDGKATILEQYLNNGELRTGQAT